MVSEVRYRQFKVEALPSAENLVPNAVYYVRANSSAPIAIFVTTNSQPVTAAQLQAALTDEQAAAAVAAYLDDNPITIQGTYRGDWAADTAYLARDITLSGGQMHTANADHNSGSVRDPARWTAWPGQTARTITATTAQLAPGAWAALDLSRGALCEIAKLTTSHACDLAIYASDADRLADQTRLTSTPDAQPTVPLLAYRTSAALLTIGGEAGALNYDPVRVGLVNRSDAPAAITVTLTVEDR